MPALLSLFPKEMLRAPRWSVVVGDQTLRGLQIEQAVLLASLSLASNTLAFELGLQEGVGWWSALRIPKAKTAGKASEIRRQFLGPTSFGVMEPNRELAYLFVASRPPQLPPLVVSEGMVQVAEMVVGKAIPFLDEAKISQLEGLVANL